MESNQVALQLVVRRHITQAPSGVSLSQLWKGVSPVLGCLQGIFLSLAAAYKSLYILVGEVYAKWMPIYM